MGMGMDMHTAWACSLHVHAHCTCVPFTARTRAASYPLGQLCKTTAMSAVEELLQAEVLREEQAEQQAELRRGGRRGGQHGQRRGERHVSRAPLQAEQAERQPGGADPAEHPGYPERAESAELVEMERELEGGLELELAPLPPLRQLTLDDFLRARAVVRPTLGRFEGVDHGLGTGLPSGPSPAAADYEESLYD